MLLDCSDWEVQLLKKSIRFVLTQVPGVVDKDVLGLIVLEKKLNAFPVTLEEMESNFIPITGGTDNIVPFFEFNSIGE